MITLDYSNIQLKLKQESGKTLVFDRVRKRWIILTPEEHVRQYILYYLIDHLVYPASLIAVEKKIMVGKLAKRFDIVVYDRDHQPWMLIECKEPGSPVNESTLFQLLSYNRTVPCRYWVLTNGHKTFCADALDTSSVRWLAVLPAYNS